MLTNQVTNNDRYISMSVNDNNELEEKENKCKKYLINIFEISFVSFNLILSVLMIINKLYYKLHNTNLLFKSTEEFVILNSIMQICVLFSNGWIIYSLRKYRHIYLNSEVNYFTLENIKYILFFITFNTLYLILVKYRNINPDGDATFVISMISYNIGAIQLVLINFNNKNYIINNNIEKYLFNCKIITLILQLAYNILVSIIHEVISCKNEDLTFKVFFCVFQYFNNWFVTNMIFNIYENTKF